MIRNAAAAVALLDGAPVTARPARISAQAALAYGYYLDRQNAKADATYAGVMRALEETGRERTTAAAELLGNWGLVHYQGDIRKAETLLRRCLELRRSIDGANAVAPTFVFNYAGVLLQLARYAEAEPLYQEAIRSARSRQMNRLVTSSTMELADLYVETGRPDRAAALLDDLKPFTKPPEFSPNRQAHLAYTRGLLALSRGDAAEARAQFAKSIALFDTVKAKFGLSVLAFLGLARAEQKLDDGDAAVAAVGKAAALAESFVEEGAPSYLIGLSRAALGEIQLSNGEQVAAKTSLTQALTHLRQTLGEEHPATRATVRLLGAPGRPAP